MSWSKKIVIRSRARGMDSKKRTAACCESFSILSMLSLVSRRRPRLRGELSRRGPGCTARANTCTACGRPSSWTAKSSRVRSDTRRPWPSRTVKVTLTTSVPAEKTGGSDFSWASAAHPAPPRRAGTGGPGGTSRLILPRCFLSAAPNEFGPFARAYKGSPTSQSVFPFVLPRRALSRETAPLWRIAVR